MSQAFHAIVNPAAGGGRCGRLAPAALDRLRASGLTVASSETRGAGDATHMARSAYDAGARAFIAVGGDGTAYEILNGVFPVARASGTRVALGFLPLGTGNSFLRDFLAEGEDAAERAIGALVAGRRRACDVVSLTLADATLLYYVNLLSFGFVAAVGALANRRFKRFGAAGYAAAVVGEVAGLRARRYRLRMDGGRWSEPEAVFVALCNSRFTGGRMMMAPYADIGDGRVDLVVAGAMGRAGLLAAFPKIFSGAHVHMPEITVGQAGAVDSDLSERIDLMIDGEIVRATPRRVEVVPSAIDVCV
jgi:diacylglycerol kinase (ATP)